MSSEESNAVTIEQIAQTALFGAAEMDEFRQYLADNLFFLSPSRSDRGRDENIGQPSNSRLQVEEIESVTRGAGTALMKTAVLESRARGFDV